MASVRGSVPRTEGADHDVVVVLDFGAQYAQLIARRVREHRVKSLILPYDVSLDALRRLSPRGLILSGGPASVYARSAPRSDPELFRLGIPILGICYGMQLMAHVLGGETGPSDRREYGRTRLFINRHDPLFFGLESRLICWMSHGDAVTRLPKDFLALAHTDAGNVAAMGQPARGLYGVQFHPEVSHTPWGSEVLRAFLLTICGCRPTWTMRSFVDQAVDEVRDALPEGRAICALSGGVDSATAAALVHRAVGDRLRCIFVDHGLLREGEADEVVRVFRDTFGIPLVHVNAERRFLERLRNVTDPEVKRRRIGEEFVRVFEEEAAGLGMATEGPDGSRDGQVDALVQGTLYPDVIESGTRTAARIKTHHNVGGLPADMRLRVIEPLRELFKDEVREVARTLGLPDTLVERHPFPGPGLAIRIAGEVTQNRLARLRRADAIVREEVRRAGKHRELWQAFAVLLPVGTVGVAGDARTYGDVVVVRAVTSQDGMTADWARLPDELLETLASRITREVPSISRVLYDVTSKPPATIEWE